jgi:putative membrane protein
MKMSTLFFATAAGLVAVPASAQVMAASEYVAIAGASDLYERTSSQIVLETTADPKLRDFAAMMLTAHAQSTADVKAAALRSKIKIAPPKLMPAQAEMIAQLRAETGVARDAAYVAQQRAAHGQALSVQQAYARDGAAPALKQAAGKIVPVVEHHLMMLMTM